MTYLRIVSGASVNEASSTCQALAVTGADAVLTAVGRRGTGATTVITDSVHSIIAAM